MKLFFKIPSRNIYNKFFIHGCHSLHSLGIPSLAISCNPDYWLSFLFTILRQWTWVSEPAFQASKVVIMQFIFTSQMQWNSKSLSYLRCFNNTTFLSTQCLRRQFISLTDEFVIKTLSANGKGNESYILTLQISVEFFLSQIISCYLILTN